MTGPFNPARAPTPEHLRNKRNDEDALIPRSHEKISVKPEESLPPPRPTVLGPKECEREKEPKKESLLVDTLEERHLNGTSGHGSG